jgi:hypothetical protein
MVAKSKHRQSFDSQSPLRLPFDYAQGKLLSVTLIITGLFRQPHYFIKSMCKHVKQFGGYLFIGVKLVAPIKLVKGGKLYYCFKKLN